MKGKKNNRRGGRGRDKFSARQRAVESADMKENIPNRFEAGKREDHDFHQGKPNDWQWYAANPQLIKDYASYPFGAPVGNQVPGFTTAVPGVMALNFVPTIGWADQENSPINIAMRRLYSYVRHANSGATNYDAPDLMLYMVAVDSALMYHAWMKRIYAVMQDYTPFNRYYPKALVTAMGANFDDIESNLNDFRGYINIYAAKIAQLWIPNSMSYMARHSWMCEGIYTDSNSAKAQTYLYTPAACYGFLLDSKGVGACRLVNMPGSATFAQIVEYGNGLINPMIANEDFGIMSGDILKAFGANGIVKVQGITENYQILPVYDQEVLSQMENCVIWGGSVSAEITQTTDVGTGYLVSKPEVTKVYSLDISNFPQRYLDQIMSNLSAPYTGSKFLNFHMDSPTPELVMVATRLMSGGTLESSVVTGNKILTMYNATTCGSEIVTNAYVYYYGNSIYNPTAGWGLQWMNVSTCDISGVSLIGTLDDAATEMSVMTRKYAMLANFDWHPGVQDYVVIANDGDASWSKNTLPVMDLDFYTLLDQNNLNNMHLTALLSEFSIPMLS